PVHQLHPFAAAGRPTTGPRPASLTAAPGHRLPGATAGGDSGANRRLSARGGGAAARRAAAPRGQHRGTRDDGDMMKSRADLGICLGYLLVAAAFFKIAVLDTATDAKNLTIADLITYYYPMMKYGFSRLRHGDIPLWNPHQACGTPFIASTHFGLLYPLYAVF